MMSGADDINAWRTTGFRQTMVSKLEEAIIHSGAPTQKNAIEMENQVYVKAKSREEYMGFVTRLIMHLKEIGTKKAAAGATIAGQQQNPNQGQRKFQMGNQGGVGQPGGVQQNPNMMQMNQMGSMNMMGQQGIVQMNAGPGGLMQASGLQQHQHNQQTMQGNTPNQMMTQSGFMQQSQMQNVQMQGNQLPSGQLQNSQIGNVPLQNQQMLSSTQNPQMSSSPRPNQPMLNAPVSSQQMHSHQMQNQQMQNSQLQNQQMQNAQMQNMQMPNQQLQEHMRSTQMGNVSMGNMQLQNSPIGGVQNSPMGSGPLNAQMGNPQLGQPHMGGQGDNQMRNVQLQGGGQQVHNIPMPTQIGSPSMQGMMPTQPPSQPIMNSRNLGGRMVGPGTMANQLSGLAKQQSGSRLHRPPSVENIGLPNQFSGQPGVMMNRAMGPQFMQSQGQPNMVQTPSPGPPSSQSQGYANSPVQSQLMPSPAAPGLPNSNIRPFHGGQLGVSSPGPSLGTPLMAAVPSPRNPEDQGCMEKIKELRKYTDLLQRMIAKIGNDDVQKSSKIKNLLEILTNPNQRVSMEILLKCEAALKKMERQQNDAGGMLGPASQPPVVKDQSQVSPFQQLMDSLNSVVKTPAASHTLIRTFRPTVELLSGRPFSTSFQQEEEERPASCDPPEQPDMPPVLQRELRTLDSRFEVVIASKGGGVCRLTCHLNDSRLPKVPPLKILVRYDYPFEPPKLTNLIRDYKTTAFLASVSRTFNSRLYNLTRNYSVIELLFMWEMCVRQAANPSAKTGKNDGISEPFSSTAPPLMIF